MMSLPKRNTTTRAQFGAGQLRAHGDMRQCQYPWPPGMSAPCIGPHDFPQIHSNLTLIRSQVLSVYGGLKWFY